MSTLKDVMYTVAEAIQRGYPLKAQAREELAMLLREEALTLRPMARVQKIAEAVNLQGGS